MNLKEKPKFTQLWPQWLAAVEVCLLNIAMGSCVGWILPFLDNLSRPNPTFIASKEQITRIPFLMYSTGLLGIVLGSILINKLGSKMTLWLGGIVYVVGGLFLISANSIHILLVSLMVQGLAIGWNFTVVGIYISEIAYSRIRGAVMVLATHGFTVGVLIGNILGNCLSPWQLGAVNLEISILFLVIFFSLPQTPYHFVQHKKLDAAEISIRWYTRGVDAKRDLESLIKFLTTNPQLSYIATFREIFKSPNLMLLVMISTIFSLMEFCGILTVSVYMEIIFSKANVTVINPANFVTILTAFGIPCCWLAMFTTDKFGRTTMLLITCIIYSVGIGGFAVKFHLLDLGYDNPNLQWIMIIGAALFRISIDTGLVPIRLTLMAELYAPNVRCLAMSINNIVMAICIFLSTTSFPITTDYMTYKNTFYIYAGCILLCGICTKIFIPETKGKTLEEIQMMLSSEKVWYKNKNNQCDVKNSTENFHKDIPVICTCD